MAAVEVIGGDITTFAVDAIVNAANTSLGPGSGVNGAIRRAGGSGLVDECRRIGGCPTGEARLTGGHDLPARHVIHTVGPVWQGGGQGEPDLLAACYRNSLDLAAAHGLRAIAFPAISTGVFGYPMEAAAGVAARTVTAWLDGPGKESSIEAVRFVCFDEAAEGIFREAVEAARPIYKDRI